MEKTVRRQLLLIELNEVNFELAAEYAERNNLEHIKRMLKEGVWRTSSEENYADLEPWIQWVSVHTGRAANEHKIFRLGDIVGSNIPQFFEMVESAGYKVGCISAMNAENRLKAPAYFLPDPWTSTPSDGSFFSRKLTSAISQAVNDNAQEKLNVNSIISLVAGLLRFARPKNYLRYFKLALKSKNAAWRKALFLDLFIHDMHLKLFQKKRPNFSTVFLNAGAYIQHHYLLNAKKGVKSKLRNPGWYISSKCDPFEEMLILYDSVIGDYLSMSDVDIVIATGLTQKPYDREKFYWRLKNHDLFLRQIGLKYRSVLPRMTRDFLIEFDSAKDSINGERLLSKIVSETDGRKIFGEIDNRGSSLFVTLTYPGEITENFLIEVNGERFDLKPHVTFVAIKNGMHDGNGFVYYKGGVKNFALAEGEHVKCLYSTITGYFGLDDQRVDVTGKIADIDSSALGKVKIAA